MQTPSAYLTGHIAVPKEWQDIFDPFYYIINQQQEAVTRILSPTFQTILVFNFGAPAYIKPAAEQPLAIDNSLVIGPVKLALEYTIPAQGQMLVANFKQDAFYRFFGRHLQTYTDFLLHPDELQGDHCFADVWQELKALPDMEQRVGSLLEFAAIYIQERDKDSEDIVNNSENDSVINPVKEIADKRGQSERNIQLKYKKYLGYSAKEMSRYQRFKKTLARLQGKSSSTVDWFEMVYEGGYYDQSHLIRDFNHFLGLSPAQYLKLQETVCIACGRS
ncbi:helix-turn-helix domain-containing protein [Chitinophaga rhizophila]|uniref:Helix-turn-helix domain-containing protein n=1 Tax=Chitinophaga rhizophila TaxID=2866212 RepID=A0ABS7GJX5_9BACT|nr:helix-turn-helix domain-containing protein [Chitinophaga rhizophila]MBW8687586.1 helix-turn-helix domain-containing protein [Chitinophaga rhizophila]